VTSFSLSVVTHDDNKTFLFVSSSIRSDSHGRVWRKSFYFYKSLKMIYLKFKFPRKHFENNSKRCIQTFTDLSCWKTQIESSQKRLCHQCVLMTKQNLADFEVIAKPSHFNAWWKALIWTSMKWNEKLLQTKKLHATRMRFNACETTSFSSVFIIYKIASNVQ